MGRLSTWGASNTLRGGGLLAGVGAVIAGVATAGFDAVGMLPRIVDGAAIAGVAATIGVIGRRLTGWPSATAALVGALGAAALAFEGFAGTAAGLLVLAGGLAAGTLLPRARAVDPLVRWVAGVGLIAAVLGWLLPWPVHRPSVWAAALMVLIGWRWAAMRSDLRRVRDGFLPLLEQAPLASLAWALVCITAGAPAWLPINNPDDLAYHLTIGQELLRYGQGRLDIGAQAWALAPWSSDLVHALDSLLAGRDSTGVLNTAWLLGTGLLIVRLGVALGLRAGHAWLASALYVSLPLTSFLAGSMQTEGPTAAALVALAIVVGFDPAPRTARMAPIAALAGFLVGMKISNALLLVPIAIWWLATWWRSMPWRALIPAVLLGAFAGGSSYFYGFALTGNPVVPMFNAQFRTPWFPAQNFEDATWQTGVPWDVAWRVVFDTGEYFEGKPGAAGIVLVLLAGGLVLAFATQRTRALSLVATAGVVLVFVQVQYLRYLHPALALWLPAVTAALLLPPVHGTRAQWPSAVLWAAVLVQLALVGKSGWMLQQGALRTLLLEGRDAVSDRFVPERALLQRWQTELQETDRVLLPDPLRSFTSLLPGRAVGTAWFTPLMARIRTAGDAANPDTWGAVVERAGANHVLVHDLSSQPGLREFLAERSAVRLDSNGAAELYRLAQDRASSTTQADDDTAKVNASLQTAQESATGAAQRRSELELPIARRHPVLGQVVLQIACNAPGEPVAVGWSLPVPDAPPVSHWEWVSCASGGLATAAVQFRAAAGAQPLVATVRAAQTGSAMTVAIQQHRLDLRRDFHAQTALADWVARWHCRRACDSAKYRLWSHPRGAWAG